MRPSKNTFYRRFLDDERIVGIESDSGLKLSFFGFFFMIVFVGAAGIFPTFVGYNMDFLLSLVFFIYTMVMFGLALIFAIIHIRCAYKYRFYRKGWYLWLFLLPFFILAIGIDILAIFTGHSYINDEGYYSYAFNPAFFFWPIFLCLSSGSSLLPMGSSMVWDGRSIDALDPSIFNRNPCKKAIFGSNLV